MRCSFCNRKMIKVDRRNELADLDGDETEGQMADHAMAELSGVNGDWNVAIVEYHCARCNSTQEVQSEQLMNFNPLIVSWHEKAGTGDYFARFVFEYLAFIAHLKNNIYFDSASDRAAIQNLKRDDSRRSTYLKRVSKNKFIQSNWIKLIKELKARPLHNTSHDLEAPEMDIWWNSDGDKPSETDTSPKGKVLSMNDWGNMIEFWCAVRNNLFHGGKTPDVQRDIFLVEKAYWTIREFVKSEIDRF